MRGRGENRDQPTVKRKNIMYDTSSAPSSSKIDSQKRDKVVNPEEELYQALKKRVDIHNQVVAARKKVIFTRIETMMKQFEDLKDVKVKSIKLYAVVDEYDNFQLGKIEADEEIDEDHEIYEHVNFESDDVAGELFQLAQEIEIHSDTELTIKIGDLNARKK